MFIIIFQNSGYVQLIFLPMHIFRTVVFIVIFDPLLEVKVAFLRLRGQLFGLTFFCEVRGQLYWFDLLSQSENCL